jgi:RND superfamily putative drug exporter
MLDSIARLTWRHPRAVLAVIGVFALVAVAFGHNVEQHLKAAGFTDSQSQSERATALLRSTLGHDAAPDIVLVVSSRDGGKLALASPTVRSEVATLASELSRARYVTRVVNPLAAGRAGRTLISRNGRLLLIPGYLDTADLENNGGVAALDAKHLIRGSPLHVEIGGYAPSFQEVNDQTRADLAHAELIAFPILAVLLLIVFRGVIAAGIPLLVGGVSILGTYLMLRVMALFVSTSLFGLNIASGLSLGLAVDYALLMVTRYREELAAGVDLEEAHRRTINTAGRTALFSGMTVAAAMAALIFFPQRFLYSVGAAGAAVGVLASSVAVLLVGSLLAVLGPNINKWSVRSQAGRLSAESGGWYRLARGVMRRPVLVAVTCAAFLLAVASPLGSTVLTGPSAQAVPPGKPSYIANQAIFDGFGRGVTESITVTVHGRASAEVLKTFDQQIAGLHGIASATPFVRASATVAYANFAPATPALSAESRHAVDRIRALAPPSGAAVLVSGNTASFIDEESSLIDHLPLVAGIIVGTTLLLLFALTGSIILPIKTLVMNALTLGATLGALVLSFQHGWLTGLLSYTGPSALEINSLVFLFAVIFGLATDYAVLVLARIKEQHDLGVPNTEAVAIGIARTGRVITAAAVMIAVVFAAFGVSQVFFMKQIAVGQAFGVLVDATVVRALLVPALMRLFGDWNWWAPRRLQRVQERLGLAER